MSEATKKKVMGKFNEIKSNIETFIADVNFTDLKSNINLLMKDAQRDFNKLINRDLDTVKRKLQKEKEEFEAKAKKFLEAQKKEITQLQVKLDRLLKATSQLNKSKKAKPQETNANSRKKVVKRVAGSSKAPGFKPKAKRKTAAKKT